MVGPGHRNPLLRATGALIALVLVVFALQAQFHLLGAGADPFFNDGVYNGLLLAAAALCIARAVTVRAERMAWAVLGVALLVWSSGDIYFSAALAGMAQPPSPSPADGLWLAFYPLAYVALVLLVRARMPGSFRTSFWLDGAIAALSVAAFAAALVFPAILHGTSGPAPAVATNLAYPVGDFILLALAAAMMGLNGWRPGRSWALIAAGLLVFGLADCIYLSQIARESYVEGTILDPLWPLGTLLMAAAAWQPAPPRSVRLDGGRLVALPSLFALASLALIVVDHFSRVTGLALALASGAILLAVVRMALVFRENVGILANSREEALTDTLTGLGNRRRLMDDLAASLVTATSRRPQVLAIFDLDGFKRYNDSFGHPAGDALLARLGSKLGAATAPYGTAYRMGGDEFCILFSPEGPGADAVLASATAALSEGGEAFAVAPSVGSVAIPRETTVASEALQIADSRMYANKDRRSRSASRQTCDALLHMLREREPDLYEHLHGVGELAVAVGRRLGLESEELDVVCRAAELHDVGKIAVPDAILQKSGPLDDDEWAFMRRHTLIGERILAAVPALVPVARLVRASHERWDGAGYPDGLAGRRIPLGARVVAVCDAYDAMVSDRPYRSGMSPLDALEELRRCAGTQFDPDVVEAFWAEMMPPLPASAEADERDPAYG